jgi:RimJ/RimL family protein N-acetyltransferase
MSDRVVEHQAGFHLPDGRLASLRPLSAADAGAVFTLYRNLSDHDRYFRFLTLNPVGLDQLVSKLIEPGKRQYAVGAFDDERLIGVANYVVCDDPSAAEVAIVVAHDHHLRGVGTALLIHLARVARTHGIRRFVADIMSENKPMLNVLSDLGWPRRRLHSGSVRRLEIELPEAPLAANEVAEASGAKCLMPQ